jgi:ketosteroid isomerase-like protein
MKNPQEVETVARNCIELFNQRTIEWVDVFYAENVEWFELPLPSTPFGQHGNRTLLRSTAQRLLSLFPDRQMKILNLISEGNRVAMELEWTGTVGANFGTFKLGSVVKYRVASFLTITEGLIVKQIDYCVPIISGAA